MFSIWWLLGAFLVGTYAGIFLIALMQVCSGVCGDADAPGSARGSRKRHIASDRQARQVAA